MVGEWFFAQLTLLSQPKPTPFWIPVLFEQKSAKEVLEQRVRSTPSCRLGFSNLENIPQKVSREVGWANIYVCIKGYITVYTLDIYIYILSVYVYICCFLCVIYIICTLYMHMFYSIRIHHMYIIYYIYNVLYIINAIYYMYEYIWFWISCRFMLHGLIWSLCLSLVILDPWIFHNVGLLDVCVST